MKSISYNSHFHFKLYSCSITYAFLHILLLLHLSFFALSTFPFPLAIWYWYCHFSCSIFYAYGFCRLPLGFFFRFLFQFGSFLISTLLGKYALISVETRKAIRPKGNNWPDRPIFNVGRCEHGSLKLNFRVFHRHTVHAIYSLSLSLHLLSFIGVWLFPSLLPYYHPLDDLLWALFPFSICQHHSIYTLDVQTAYLLYLLFNLTLLMNFKVNQF